MENHHPTLKVNQLEHDHASEYCLTRKARIDARQGGKGGGATQWQTRF